MALEKAVAVAKQIKLSPWHTHIEPSRFSGFLFDNVSVATLLRLTFDAKHWPTKVADLYLMYVERSPEVSDWIASCSDEFEFVEIVAILFGSDEDQESFEAVIWPAR